MERRALNDAHWLPQSGEFPQLRRASASSPAFYIWSPSPLCCSGAVHSALSCLIGVTALYLGVYSSLLRAGDEFSVLLATTILDLLPPSFNEATEKLNCKEPLRVGGGGKGVDTPVK